MSQIKTRWAFSMQGDYTPPGDKSISHRLIILGALAEGTSEFQHFLEGDDCLRTIAAFQAMGVCFKRESGKVIVKGVGLAGLKKPKEDLDLGNSGTSTRLLLGVLAGQPFETCLKGDESLSRRPMKRVTQPLRQMGANITGRDDANFMPLTIQGGQLNSIDWKSKIPSAQVKSAILLASLFADGQTRYEEAIQSRDHTERLFLKFGALLRKSGNVLSIERPARLYPIQMDVPGDISSAAFFIVAASILPDTALWVKRVNLNPTRTGILDVLKKMGAKIKIEMIDDDAEPVGNIHIESSVLQGVEIGPDLIPSLIDELPILMIACALAKGKSVIRGAEELRVKETDRIRSMVLGLQAIGAKAEERPDGCVIEGVSEFKGGAINSFGDHRTAMSFAIAGLRSSGEILIEDTDCIKTSYPNFEEDLQKVAIF
jgi:3-phosphoshikimate 1-carboxyvinyltransferase